MVFFSNKKKVNKAINIVKKRNIENLRRKVRILVVDDEDFSIIDTLKTRGYDIYKKNDITYPIETEPFDIVLLDIKGIASKFASPMEGFGFALEIKKRYPQKIVISFSGTSDAKINERLNEINGFIYKDTDIDTWCSRLDGYIKKYCDVNYQWECIAGKMKSDGIEDNIINTLKDCFIDGYENNTFDDFSRTFMEHVNNAKFLMETLNLLVSLLQLVC